MKYASKGAQSVQPEQELLECSLDRDKGQLGMNQKRRNTAEIRPKKGQDVIETEEEEISQDVESQLAREENR